MSPGVALYRDRDEKNRLEARNARLQYRETVRLIEESAGSLNLTPAIIKRLHWFAIKDIYSCAGEYRDWPVKLKGSSHRPPEHHYVSGLVEEMCERVTANPDGWDAVQIAAYLLWRLNWIHPFGGGNGRTSRAASYLALCDGLGGHISGSPTLAEFIDDNRASYVAALKEADAAAGLGFIDFSQMESLLNRWLEEEPPDDCP